MVNSLPGQVKAVASHPINTPSGQVGVTPHNSEGIEPFTMVNSSPFQVGAVSSHPINTPSGPLRVTSSIFSQGSISDSPCVAPVSPPTSSDGFLPVMSPPCPLSLPASSPH